MSASDSSKIGKVDLVACSFAQHECSRGEPAPPKARCAARPNRQWSNARVAHRWTWARRGAAREMGDPRARRRIGVKIIMHTLTDGGGELRPVRRCAQP